MKITKKLLFSFGEWSILRSSRTATAKDESLTAPYICKKNMESLSQNKVIKDFYIISRYGLFKKIKFILTEKSFFSENISYTYGT